MQEFTLIFRMDILNESVQPTPEQMEIYMHNWMKWINDISYKGQLATGGNHFSPGIAKVIYPKGVETDGPYVVNNESIAGYIIVFATDINDAVFLCFCL